MHVYHYNHTERTSLVRLSQQHGVAELELERLIETGMFVDLYPIVTASLQAGRRATGSRRWSASPAMSVVIRSIEERGALLEYERWMADHDDDHLTKIAAYNEDDVRATKALRDWLLEQRPVALSWREAKLENYADNPDLDARIEALHALRHAPTST